MALSLEKIDKIKIDFEAGIIPVTEIAKKHSVSRATILRLAKKEKWSRKNRKKQDKPSPKPKAKRGRPKKYNPDQNKMVTALCMLGYTDKQLVGFIGIEERTFYKWKKIHVEFSQALRNGRETASAKVSASLFQRATGYGCDEVKEEYEDDKLIKKTVTKKKYPPDVKAITLWLKNKYPELWREELSVQHEVNSQGDTPRKITIEFIGSDEDSTS